MSVDLAAAIGALPPRAVDALVAIVGACIGSFLNVVIVRLPAGRSIVRPASHCECGAPIGWRDNIPILSWLLLSGRARCCGRTIAVRYPLVELGTAAAFVLCWHRLAPGPAACGAIFLSALIAAGCIDLEHMIIPEPLTVGLGMTGIVLSFAVPALHGQSGNLYLLDAIRSTGVALEGLLVGSGLVLWIASIAGILLKREAMGMGDVFFVGAIGAFCGWHGAVFSIFGGAGIGLIWVIVALIFRSHPRLTARIPFGPMLALAAALYLLFLHPCVDAWFAQVSTLFP